MSARAAKRALTERTPVRVTHVFGVISGVKGRRPEGGKNLAGEGCEVCCHGARAAEACGVEMQCNAMQTEVVVVGDWGGVGKGGSKKRKRGMHCVSSLWLAVLLLSLFARPEAQRLC